MCSSRQLKASSFCLWLSIVALEMVPSYIGYKNNAFKHFPWAARSWMHKNLVLYTIGALDIVKQYINTASGCKGALRLTHWVSFTHNCTQGVYLCAQKTKHHLNKLHIWLHFYAEFIKWWHRSFLLLFLLIIRTQHNFDPETRFTFYAQNEKAKSLLSYDTIVYTFQTVAKI